MTQVAKVPPQEVFAAQSHAPSDNIYGQVHILKLFVTLGQEWDPGSTQFEFLQNQNTFPLLEQFGLEFGNYLTWRIFHHNHNLTIWCDGNLFRLPQRDPGARYSLQLTSPY